jgi:hypothetical protein
VANGLVAQLRAAQSAADASILVDPGCTAIESKTTEKLESKLLTDDTNLANAEKGTDYSAFVSALNNYINDIQTISTDMQQDAALSSRSNLKSAVSTFTGDLNVVISAMQSLLAGNYSTTLDNNVNAALNRMDGDGTAVDTICGSTALSGTGSSSSSSGSGTTSA